jgi:N-acetylglucosaminyldiphosphoundecaprenol N-acetyl-beta-D-mannosaminyltransferase
MKYHSKPDEHGTAAAALPFSLTHDIPLAWLGGLPIAVIDRAGSAELMLDLALARRGAGAPPLYITSANGQVLSICARDEAIRAIFLSADLIHADGTPLVIASRLKSRRLPERVATTDLFDDVAARAEQRGATFYLLGAAPDVIARAAQRTRERYPRLNIVGYRSGYFSAAEEDQIIAEINAAGPDVLWIGMGVPAEQSFSIRNRARLTGVGVIKTSGGLFDFVSGTNSRAPRWMQAAGLEWAYRMILEPRRLAYRYLTTNPHALYLLLMARTSGGAPLTEKRG